jgi:hypothetical protein
MTLKPKRSGFPERGVVEYHGSGLEIGLDTPPDY